VAFMVARYREMYWPNAIDVPLYPGIREMLEKLRARGYRLGLATTKSQEMSLQILQHLGIADFFEVVSGVIPDTSRVDKPAVIGWALQQFGVEEPQDKRRVVMVGDRFYDIEGAQINGISAILTTWGDTTQPGEERGAVQVVSTPAELLSALGVHPG
ncbi:HAD hydrolase-like protein, partial [Mobiluncus curtisii]